MNPGSCIGRIRFRSGLLRRCKWAFCRSANGCQIWKSWYLLLICLLFSNPAYSIENYPVGAGPASMAGVWIMQAGFWSLWHNQAGLASVDKFSAGIHHETRFMVKELALSAIGITLPTSSGTFGLSLTRFGYSRYAENKVGLALGRAFNDRFSAGLQLDYLNRFIGPETGLAATSPATISSAPTGPSGTGIAGAAGSRTAGIAFEAGIITEPVENLLIGVHVYNPAGTGKVLQAPTIIRIGIGYRFDSRLFMGLETERSLEYPVSLFRAGAEYRIIDYIYIRTGLSLQDDVQHSFGLGFLWNRLRADLAFSYRQIAGYTPYLSLQYVFR